VVAGDQSKQLTQAVADLRAAVEELREAKNAETKVVVDASNDIKLTGITDPSSEIQEKLRELEDLIANGHEKAVEEALDKMNRNLGL
jgi:hypothetical protein